MMSLCQSFFSLRIGLRISLAKLSISTAVQSSAGDRRQGRGGGRGQGGRSRRRRQEQEQEAGAGAKGSFLVLLVVRLPPVPAPVLAGITQAGGDAIDGSGQRIV